MRRLLPAPRLLPATIAVMAALLCVKCAGLLRLAAPAQAAASAAASATGPMLPPVAQAAACPPADSPPDPLPAGGGEGELLQELRQRSEKLDAREAALRDREDIDAAAGKRLSARLAELESLQTSLEALEAARKSRDEASWQGLVRVYEAMKPRDAAVIFDDLDMPVLLQVVDRMKDRKAALVLAAMQPERARDLTAQLAALRINANRLAPAASATP